VNEPVLVCLHIGGWEGGPGEGRAVHRGVCVRRALPAAPAARYSLFPHHPRSLAVHFPRRPACVCLQKQLELKRIEDQRKRELAKRVNWLAMTPKKRERFRQIRMWKKTEVAGLIQRWWRYLMGQKKYYEAVKTAQVQTTGDAAAAFSPCPLPPPPRARAPPAPAS
jgi:hypothetical protein